MTSVIGRWRCRQCGSENPVVTIEHEWTVTKRLSARMDIDEINYEVCSCARGEGETENTCCPSEAAFPFTDDGECMAEPVDDMGPTTLSFDPWEWGWSDGDFTLESDEVDFADASYQVGCCGERADRLRDLIDVWREDETETESEPEVEIKLTWERKRGSGEFVCFDGSNTTAERATVHTSWASAIKRALRTGFMSGEKRGYLIEVVINGVTHRLEYPSREEIAKFLEDARDGNVSKPMFIPLVVETQASEMDDLLADLADLP